MMQLITPVVLFLYKRPETTVQVIRSISNVKPRKIYLIADGPKSVQERSLSNEARKIVEDNIDWQCDVIKYYSNKNLGLRRRIESGLNMVFQKEDKAIILEDDCVADSSFFYFSQNLLDLYKNNHSIMAISGSNFLFDRQKVKDSYYFSHYPHSWGWATWKRAWNKYDPHISDWPKFKHSLEFKQIFPNKLARYYWKMVFDSIYKDKIDSWAYRWTYSCIKNNLLCITPAKNLVKNIGVGMSATHTKFKTKAISQSIDSMNFPLIHPQIFALNYEFDRITEKHLYLNIRNLIGASLKWIRQ